MQIYEREIVIGDIHNAHLGLKQLVERIVPTVNDKFRFIGDFVDGWSQAVETINYLIEFKKKFNCDFLEGNHDTWFLEFLLTGRADRNWLMNGGHTTLASYEKGLKEGTVNKQEYIDFFFSLKPYIITDDNIAFVHAGYTNSFGIPFDTKTNLLWDRSLWETATSGHPEFKVSGNLPHLLRLYKHIYIGHTATSWTHKDMLPVTLCNVTNVDQGAGWSGKLTALEINTKEVWQSDLVKTLYPDEKGR